MESGISSDLIARAGERVLKALDLSQYNALNEIMTADTKRCAEELRRNPSQPQDLDQFWVRALGRFFFSQVEGTLYQLRQLVIRAYDISLVDLAP
jgi:hypothetical protein